ncbi:uncharacterized protein bbx isoform X2 [Bemisia tabaci]
MNAFLIFCKRQRAVVKERFPQLENRAVTKILGEWWANLEEGEKSSYTDLAKQYREAFLKANPGFKWYKLPAPTLRPISNRLKLLPDLISHQDSITPGKLADESQLGGLTSLLVPYNNMSVSPTFAVQCVPKPPKKRYLEENATSDDLNQILDEMPNKVALESEAVPSYSENDSSAIKAMEIEPFAKLRNYSVTAKENIAQVENKADGKSMLLLSNGSLEASSINSCLVVKSNNNSFSYTCDRSNLKVKCEEMVLVSDRSKSPSNLNSSTYNSLNNSTDGPNVKWKTKFDKIKSRHLNYNNNNVNETYDSLKCSSYECNSNQDTLLNKVVNGNLKVEPRDLDIKIEDASMNGFLIQAASKLDCFGTECKSSTQIALDSGKSTVLSQASSMAPKSSLKSDQVFFHENKLPNTKTADKPLNKPPIVSDASDTNFMRRNKSVRACKGARYQEFMSSNQLGRKRRRKNTPNDSRYEGHEEEEMLNHRLSKSGLEEFKPAKEEKHYEKMEIESMIYNINDNLDQSSLIANDMFLTNTAVNKFAHSRPGKQVRPTKPRKSVTAPKSHLPDSPSDNTNVDKEDTGTNFNLEEKIDALPALSLEEFQEKKRLKTKKHSSLENGQDALSNGVEKQPQFQCESHPKPLICNTSTGSDSCNRIVNAESRSKSEGGPIENSSIMNTVSKHEAMKSVNKELLNAFLFTSGSASSSSNGVMSDQKSSLSGTADGTLVGSRKRKARRQKITHLEPGSKKKDTSVVEVDILNDMGLATLAEVATLSRKESILKISS